MIETEKLTKQIEWAEYQPLINKNDWTSLSLIPNLPEEFIEAHQWQVKWDTICWRQNLSDPFMRKMWYHLEWETIATYQTLTEQFIEDFIEFMPVRTWLNIFQDQPITVEFKEKHRWRYKLANKRLTGTGFISWRHYFTQRYPNKNDKTTYLDNLNIYGNP